MLWYNDSYDDLGYHQIGILIRKLFIMLNNLIIYQTFHLVLVSDIFRFSPFVFSPKLSKAHTVDPLLQAAASNLFDEIFTQNLQRGPG